MDSTPLSASQMLRNGGGAGGAESLAAPLGGVRLRLREPSLKPELLPCTGVEGDLVALGDLLRYDDSCLSCTRGVNSRLGYSLSVCNAIARRYTAPSTGYQVFEPAFGGPMPPQ